VVRPEPEVWIDEGPVRRAASRAVRRGATPSLHERATPSRERAVERDDQLTAQVTGRGEAARREEIAQRLTDATRTFERERYADARRMASAIVRTAPEVAAAHELLGLAQYRLGNFRQAASVLETWRTMTRSVEHHPVLADCYRALKKYDKVDELWQELKEASPSAALVAEGRIVAAGALADRGDLDAAIAIMQHTDRVPARVRDHHLRLWYVLADLYDRSGDPIKAGAVFSRIVSNEPDFADAQERLRALGR
jgi:tetratricopeptide (TPR) repeat protein